MHKNKRETGRWLNALNIAKVIFWHEGYHTQYLEQIESFIRRKQMYSPRIREDLISKLYKLAKELKMPMTRLVNKIIEECLKKYQKNS